METGVYKITNKLNNKFYIGSTTKNFNSRWKAHLYQLSYQKHNPHLQRAFNKYGKENFTFEIVEECSPELCVEREQHYLDLLRPFDSIKGYNISPTARNCFGVKHTIKTKQLQSLQRKGKPSKTTKTVYQYSLDGIFIKSWRHAGEAAGSISDKNVKYFRRNIQKACKNRLTVLGYKWSYLEPNNYIFSKYIKTVLQYDLAFNFIKEYHNSVEAAKSVKTSNILSASSNIRMVCRGLRKDAYGYIWKFINLSPTASLH